MRHWKLSLLRDGTEVGLVMQLSSKVTLKHSILVLLLLTNLDLKLRKSIRRFKSH